MILSPQKSLPKLRDAGLLPHLLFFALAFLPLANLYIPIGPAELAPSEMVVVGLFVALTARKIMIAGKIRVPRKLRIMVACTFALALSTTLSGFMTGNLTTAIRLAISALFALFMAITAYRFGPRAWVTPVLIGVTVSIVVAFGHLTNLVPLMEFERPSSGIATSGIFQIGYTGLVSARGEYGILLLLGVAAAMIGLAGTWKWTFLCALLFAGLITISRSTWFALSTACVVMGLLFLLPGRTLSGRIKNLFFLLMVLALMAAPLSYLGFFGWIEEQFSALVGLRASSFDGRLAQFAYFLETADEFFWFGGGSNQFVQIFGYAIHNTQMGVYLAFGFLPAVLYCVLFLGAGFKSLTLAAKSRNPISKKQAGILCAVMCGCFIEASLYPKASSLIMWTLIGIAWGHAAYLTRTDIGSGSSRTQSPHFSPIHYGQSERSD